MVSMLIDEAAGSARASLLRSLLNSFCLMFSAAFLFSSLCLGERVAGEQHQRARGSSAASGRDDQRGD